MSDERPKDETPDQGPDDGSGDTAASTTGVGQVVQSLARSTRSLAADRRTGAYVATAALRERVSTLMLALGDPGHPLHQRAVDDLVALGEPAVPALTEALRPSRPWLTAYRAAEALGQIGDGRAAGPLTEALRHPNSNVRWSAVRALASVGDARALLALRRVARDDRSKTSWGEPVAGAAQAALDQMQSSTLLLRGADLIKTAVACVLMLVSLILAWSVLTSLRAELAQVGRAEVAPVIVVPPVRTAVPQAPAPLPTPVPTPAPAATAVLPGPSGVVTGTVVTSGNVRAAPDRSGDNVVGNIVVGDVLEFLAVTPDSEWYLVRLGGQVAPGSTIGTPDGSGWVSRSLVAAPAATLPIEEAPTPSP